MCQLPARFTSQLAIVEELQQVSGEDEMLESSALKPFECWMLAVKKCGRSPLLSPYFMKFLFPPHSRMPERGGVLNKLWASVNYP